tara:strand:- start:326 stop:622 length:297 start_codon:yes stop_codon:yes gene_type:complete
MSYKITAYTRRQAKKLGVTVKPSELKNKKIDVFYKGKKLASVGDSRYLDFPTYTKEKGKAFADERRRLYRIRHAKDMKKVPGGIEKQKPGFFAANLLW